MDNDKNMDFDEDMGTKEGDFTQDTATRARNRTVMLTPEITGQVRARLQQEMEGGQQAPFTRPDAAPSGSFITGAAMGTPPGGSGFYTPAGRPGPSAIQSGALDTGHRAPQAAAPRTMMADGAVWTSESPIAGFLVSYDANTNGDVFTLRSGRLIITSAPQSSGNYILVNDESVSPLHAIMRVGSSGDIQILDQLSEHGTKIQRAGSQDEEELSGEKSSLTHGDVVRFGKRSFHVCLVVRREISE